MHCSLVRLVFTLKSFRYSSIMNVIITLLLVILLCEHLTTGYFWRESIAWRNDYAEQTSYYVYFDFVGVDYPALLAGLHSSDEPSYDVDFDVDVVAHGLPLDYLIAMRIFYANTLERMRLIPPRYHQHCPLRPIVNDEPSSRSPCRLPTNDKHWSSCAIDFKGSSTSTGRTRTL